MSIIDGPREAKIQQLGPNGDFVFATRSRALQLRYLVRLYVKELVLRNFAGLPAEQLTERMIELTLYVEDNLKPA